MIYYCDYCGKKDEKARSKIKRTERNFCSNRCKHKYFRENKEIFKKQERKKIGVE